VRSRWLGAAEPQHPVKARSQSAGDPATITSPGVVGDLRWL